MGKRVLHKNKMLSYIALWVVFVLVLLFFSIWLGREVLQKEHTPPVVIEKVEPVAPPVESIPEHDPELKPEPESEIVPKEDLPVVTVAKYKFGDAVAESPMVENTYFADCAFVGNSLIEGFKMHSGLKIGHYYTYKGIAVSDINEKKKFKLKSGAMGTVLQGLAESQHNRVYVMMGLNEMGYRSYEVFSKRYGQLITDIKTSQPNAEIIVLSVLPVTKTRSDKDGVFNLKNVKIFQELVRKVAQDNEVYYLNLAEAFVDKDGYLPENMSKDGVHLTSPHYATWLEYLKTHTIDQYLEKK